MLKYPSLLIALSISPLWGNVAGELERADEALLNEEAILIESFNHVSDSSDEEIDESQSNVRPVNPGNQPKPNNEAVAPPIPPQDLELKNIPSTATPPTGQQASADGIVTEATKKNYTSTSSSRQFLVSGKEPIVCSAISVKAEELKKSLFKILKLPPEWKSTIHIHLVGKKGELPPPNPIRTQTLLDDGDLYYHIYVHAGRGVNIEKLNQAIITTLMYEITLRNIPTESLPENVELPPWLQIGIEQAILWDTDQADRSFYATMFNNNSIIDIQKLLTIKSPSTELDATTYTTYKASAGALILCLLRQNNGQEGMKSILNEAIMGSEDSENLIKRNFPQLNLTPTSLHKWWSLQMAQMATAPLTETHNIPDTDKRLSEALQVFNYNPTTRTTQVISLENLNALAAIPDLDNQLKEVSNNLVHTSRRAFPAYQPIIVEYAKFVALLQAKKITPHDGEKRLAQLKELREKLLQTAVQVRDYMDWYEITTKTSNPSTFDSYLRTMSILRSQNSSPNTPLSQYLEDIEKLHTQPAQSKLPKLHPSYTPKED